MKKSVMIISILLMAIVCLTEKTYAKTFTTTEQYRVYKCDSGNDYENCDFTSWTNNGTATSNTPSSKVIRGFSMNFAQSETLSQGGLFRVVIDFKATPKDNGVQILHSYTCWGSTSNGTSGGLEENIQQCDLISTIPTTDGVRYIFNVTPAINIKSIKINIYLNTGIPFTSITGLAKSSLSNDTSTSDAINEQTDNLIDNQNQNTQDIINNQNELMGSKCKNLLKITDGTYSNNGITAKVQNGVVTVNGTANDTSFVDLNIPITVNLNGTYRLSAYNTNIINNENTGIRLNMTDGTNTVLVTMENSNNHQDYTINNKTLRFLTIRTSTGVSYSSFIIKPMLTNDNSVNSWCEYGTFTSKLDETNNILNQDHTYNNNASQSTTNQENQMNSFEQEEDALRNNLNLNIEDAEITINPNASNFIWDVVNRLRTMSGKIVLLFTSVLSLGIMKMILGR